MADGGSFDGKSPRIDLVPIIDAMTCVIFFLLLSSTFIEYTKITMPSAISVVSATSVAKDPPVSPKLIGAIKGSYIYLTLSWAGNSPDKIVRKIKRDPDNKRSEELQSSAFDVVDEFIKKYPGEKTMLLGFSSKATYQEVISTMDGARKVLQDLVMVSWKDSSWSLSAKTREQ